MTKFATPTLADAGSNVVRPDAAAQQAEVARRAEQSGLSSVKNLFSAETIGSAYQLTPVAMAGWSATGFAYPPDPSFRLSPEQISEFIDGIDPAYAPMVTQARSAEHMAFLKGQAQELSRKRQVLADAGWGGSIAAVGSQILEPVNLSAMVAGNYAAAAAPFVTGVQAARASRLSRAVQNGFVQAGTSAAVEGVRNVVDPTAMPGASVANVLSDLAMGGAVGGLSDQARYVRALAGGAGAAAPQAAYIAVSDDVRTEEASSIMFWSLVMGGGFSAIAPATRLDNAIANAATEFDKKVDALTIHSMNLPLTRRGRAVLGQYAPDLATERANAQMAQMAGIEGPPRPVEVRSAATEVPTTPGVKQPWEMTAQEHGAYLIQRDGIDPKYVVSISENGSLVMLKGAPEAQTRRGARGSIKDGINNRGNINAALLDAVNRNTDHPLTLPDGYVREGDYYVYRGTDAPPTPRSAATEVPPVPEGHTRLWRGNRPGGVDAGNPSYTTDRAGIAEPFARAYGGDLTYVDVPTESLASMGAGPGGAPDAEFILPESFVRQAKPATTTKPAATGGTANTPGAKQADLAKPAAVLYLDEHENAVVDDGIDFRITVDKPGDASRVVLWTKQEVSGKTYWRKSGSLDANEKSKKVGGKLGQYLGVSSIEIDQSMRGRGHGTRMYRALMAQARPDIAGVISYTPNRVNKSQVPKIYKRLGAFAEGDYQIIPRSAQPTSSADSAAKSPAATGGTAGAPIEPKVFYVPTDPYTKTQVGATNVGAAQAAATTPKPIDPKIDIYDFSNIHDGSTRFVGKVKGIPTIRFDQGALAGQSAISEYRALNNLFSTDPVSRMSSSGTETVAPFSLMESNVAHVGNVFSNEYMGKMKPVYEAWVKEQAKTGIGNMGARIWGDANNDAFARAVADAVDTLAAGGTVNSPALQQAAQATTDLLAGQWKLMHHWGVEGVDQPNAPITNYVPHRYKRPAIDDLISKHAGNRDELIEAIGQQVIRPNLKARGTQTAADLDALADVFARAIIDKGGMPGVEDSFIHGLSSSDADDLIDQLGFTNDPVAAAHIRTYVAPEGGKPSFLQQRIPLNPLQSFTTSQGTFRMKDVMERNIFTLAHSYVRRSTGQASLAAAEPVFQKMYGTTDRISSPRAFSAYLQKKAKELQTTMGIAPEESNIARLEASYKAVAGLPMWTPGSRSADAWGSIVRSIINNNFFRLMSGPRAAMNPIQDFVGAISGPDGTMGAAKRFFPDAFSIVTKMRTGQRPDAALIRTANEMGLGVRGNHFLSGIRDTEGYYHPRLQQIENVTGTLARIGARTSLQDVGQDFAERMTYNREAQSFLDLADTVLDERRVLQDGVTPAQMKVIQEQIKQHAVVKDGVLMDENFNAWTNPRAAWMYRMMMRRRVNRSLNLGDATQQPLTIAGIPTASPLGRMVSQFRRFPLMAQTNKIGAGLDRGAAFMAHATVSGGVSAMMAYSVGVYLDSIGRPDQQEYLDRMLSDEMIMKAAFGRNAMTALTPAAVDTLVAMTDNKPIFAPTRVTGLGQDNGALSLWTQNPTGDWFASALGSIAAFRAPIDSNYDFSQRNMRAIEGATWVPKAFGISNALRSMSSGLPERSKQDQ